MTGERAAIERRRACLFDKASQSATTWGLALSGGGIRSATFCLGVLQALAQAKFSSSGDRAKDGTIPLLARFDYLSTVSGGGYIGSFLSALFRPRERDVRSGEARSIAPEQAAKDAYAALRHDPPGRLGADDLVASEDAPVRWLRENGRYLTPNGPGDLLYDISIAGRNWLSVHYIAAITLLTLFLLAFAFRQISVYLLGTPAQTIEMLVQAGNPLLPGAIWGSPWFVAMGAWMALVSIPLGIAYWYRLDSPPKSAWSPANPWIAAAIVVVLAACLLFLLAAAPKGRPASMSELLANGEQAALLLLVTIITISIVLFHIANAAAPESSRVFRAKITRWLSNSMGIVFLIALFAFVETGGQTLYLWLRNSPNFVPTVGGIVAVVIALVSTVRALSPMLAQPDKDSLLSRIPLDAILGIVGIMLLFLLLISWHAFASLLFLGRVELVDGSKPLIMAAQFKLLDDPRPWLFLLVCIAATCAAGAFLGFINLSGLQALYSARLTRAYLGASNRTRFGGEGGRLKRVTEPDKDDDFSRSEYFDDASLGPAHIINVTINATTGREDQLTQRDRQGLPMAISPDGITVEGRQWNQPGAAELSIGQWTAVSGAAFSTGVGRGTSLGKALLLGMTNVRLGWWWKSGLTDSKSVHPFWRTQAYLLRELRASFIGKDGSHWYLSDGGHFENTGVFELLRRKVDVVLCCDCGADPQYEFEDIANLMRLARIDLQAEFHPIGAADTPLFSERADSLATLVALGPADFSTKPGSDNKCVLLYRVTYRSCAQTTLLIVIKPRLIKDVPLDLMQYQATHADFPQQSTLHQFFGDSQWESYRKLGVLVGRRLFPD